MQTDNLNKILERASTSNLVKLLLFHEQQGKIFVSIAKKRKIECIKQGDIENFLELSYYLGRYDFDEFMLAMELERPVNDRFWSRRRHILELRHGIASKYQAFVESRGIVTMLVSMPPGVAKTACNNFLLAWYIGNHEKSMNMFVTYTSKVATASFDEICEMITSEKYNFRKIFPNFPQKIFQDNVTLELTLESKGNKPVLSAISLGGSVTGVTRANGLQINDDLVSGSEMARSEYQMENLWTNYNETVKSRTTGDNYKVFTTGTIWSTLDPISRLLENSSNKRLIIPIENDKGEPNFDFGLSDTGYPKVAIDILKEDQEPSFFNSMYMCEPTEKGGKTLWKPLKRFDINSDLPKITPDIIGISADIAFGGNDFLSAPAWFYYDNIDGEQRVYFVDVVFNQRTKLDKREEEKLSEKEKNRENIILVAKLIDKYLIERGIFESNNAGDWFADAVKETATRIFNLIKRRTTKNKLDRIEAHVEFIQDNCYFSNSLPQNFINQIVGHSAAAKHDDAIDSVVICIENVRKQKKQNNTYTLMPRLF